MATNRVGVSTAVIDWAFATTDLDAAVQATVVKQNRWLQTSYAHYLEPTVKQLGQFAARLHVPFANLLMPQPPKPEDIRMAFRTRGNVPAVVSLTARDVIHEMQRKQSWFKEDSGISLQPLSFIGQSTHASVGNTSAMSNSLLTLRHFKSARELFNDLRRQLTALGVLNMQKGGAGLGTNRPLDVAELRAFVLFDEVAPLIFVNQRDSYTARVFSLVHEFVHLLRGSDELLGADREVEEERLINRVVEQFLLPETEFLHRFDPMAPDRTSRYFNVSNQAVAIRAIHLGLIHDLAEVTMPEFRPVKKGNGGNPYNTALSINDSRYMNALVVASQRGDLQPTQTASLIGVSLKMLDRTVATFNEREASK